METVRSLYAQAYEAVDRALASHGAVRYRLIEKAVHLHRSAIEHQRLLSEKIPPDPKDR